MDRRVSAPQPRSGQTLNTMQRVHTPGGLTIEERQRFLQKDLDAWLA
jgi:hypothetical protein